MHRLRKPSPAARAPAPLTASHLEHLLNGSDEIAVNVDQTAIKGQMKFFALVDVDGGPLQDDRAICGEVDRWRLVVFASFPN
jgi:hypothetical protein